MAVTADLQTRSEAQNTGPSLTEQLAEFVVRTRAEDIPEHVIHTAAGFVLDTLGCAIAGLPSKPARAVMPYTERQPTGPASCLGLGEGRTAEVAAFHNGALAHIVEMDDVDRGSVTHPGAVMIPAALAVAEELGRSGRDFLVAVILGYEVAIRIGESVGKRHYFHWHNTSTCGIFGAAAAAGWLIGLNQDQLTWALGNAGTMAFGLWQFIQEGAMSKHVHTGRAAANGVLAAELARYDFTGARRILEGPQGFFAAMCPDGDPSVVTRGLGDGTWKLPGVSIKPYPSCRHTHSAVDAALRLRQQLGPIEPDQVARIDVAGYHSILDLCDNPNPRSLYAAKFSIYYTVARALLDGQLRLNDFTDDAITEPRVGDLMAKTTACLDERLDRLYPAQFPARVTLRLTDGRVLTEEVLTPKGDPECALSDDDLDTKFLGMLRGTPYAGREEELRAAFRGLPERGSVQGLLAMAVGAPT